MKRNPLKNMIKFVVRYIWIFCALLIVLELCSTLLSAAFLLKQTSNAVLQSQMGEVSGRVDGVLRLLNGFANDRVLGDTQLPIFDRATKLISYQSSYDLYMLAVLDKDFNVVSADETEPPTEPFSLAGRDYLQRMKVSGKYQITDAMIAGADNVTKNYTIAVPTFRDGQLEGGIFGSIYFDDIEAMLKRNNRSVFYLLGRENKVMAGGEQYEDGKTLQELYKGLWLIGTTPEEMETRMSENRCGDFWIMGNLGPAYVTYCNVDLTDWTLVYESRLDMVFPMVFPMLLTKVVFYALLCWCISYFGRRYLERQLADISHLLDKVTVIQRELFQSERVDYNELLDLTQQGLADQLTGLATRGVLITRFSQFVEIGQHKGMLCFIDLDDLKTINDSYGHEAGDCALIHFAQVLKRYQEKYNGIAARYGGDEFVLVLEGVEVADGNSLAEALCIELETVLHVKSKEFTIHGSIGGSFYPTHGTSFEELISKADLALYAAKRNGKNGYAIFENQQ